MAESIFWNGIKDLGNIFVEVKGAGTEEMELFLGTAAWVDEIEELLAILNHNTYESYEYV